MIKFHKIKPPRCWGVSFGPWFFGLVLFEPEPDKLDGPINPTPVGSSLVSFPDGPINPPVQGRSPQGFSFPDRPVVPTKPATFRELAPGCCSAVFPCSHQQRDPTTICSICRDAENRPK